VWHRRAAPARQRKAAIGCLHPICRRVLDPAAEASPIELVDYQDATHDFDDPGNKRQRDPGNQDAREDVRKRAAEIFGK
jgi:dienelactone hydrolase